MLSVSGLRAFHGPVEALKGVDLEVGPGEIVTLIGANGAGKSTLLMTICGRPRAAAGRVLFGGVDITARPCFEIARLGIAQVPEGRRIFPRMTVLENLLMGTMAAGKAAPSSDLASSSDLAPSSDLEWVFALFPVLAERRKQRGGTLSGGEQQMLAIGRALMARPRLLLLDEPSLGLAPLVIRHIFDVLAAINRERGLPILLVEQNAVLALKLAHRGYVLQTGNVILRGSGAELLADPAVRAAYLAET